MTKRKAIPESTRAEVVRRLQARASQRWPKAQLIVTWRGRFGYVDATTPVEGDFRLCRLGYLGSPHSWEFAFFKYSSETYAPCLLASGSFVGSPEECLECAGMYLDGAK